MEDYEKNKYDKQCYKCKHFVLGSDLDAGGYSDPTGMRKSHGHIWWNHYCTFEISNKAMVGIMTHHGYGEQVHCRDKNPNCKCLYFEKGTFDFAQFAIDRGDGPYLYDVKKQVFTENEERKKSNQIKPVAPPDTTLLWIMILGALIICAAIAA